MVIMVTTHGSGPTPTDPRVLVFDVLGTLLDEDSGQLDAVRREPALRSVPAEDFVERWSTRFAELMRSVQAGLEPYRVSEVLYAEAVRDVAADEGLALPDDSVVRLARFGRSLDPFPEVPEAMDALSRRFGLVALTNAGTAQAFAMSHHAGLRWSTVLSGEVVQAYKPDPRMYRHAIKALDLRPDHCVFVAAHQWDLDAAAEHGFRTAYLDRAADAHRARADVRAEDLVALGHQLE